MKNATSTPVSGKPKLLFLIDQGFGNGILAQHDTVALQRVMLGLKAFQTKYDVYALISPSESEQSNLDWMLDTLSSNGIPFALTVYSSDVIQIGDTPYFHPYDPGHGLALSVPELQALKVKYGSMFVGVRAFEVYATQHAVLTCYRAQASGNPNDSNLNYCQPGRVNYDATLPPLNNPFYQESILEPYVKFAHDNQMFLEFGDFWWHSLFPGDWNDQNQQLYEQQLTNLINKYPDTIIPTFGTETASTTLYLSRTNTWQNVVQPFASSGAAMGFGLSDQSWMCHSDLFCPASAIATYATNAFARGAVMVQFEPTWYFWELPRMYIPNNPNTQVPDYTTNAAWADRGYATTDLVAIAQALGITLPADAISPETTAPTVAFTGPTNNTTVSGTTTLAVQTSDSRSPIYVELQIDGAMLSQLSYARLLNGVEFDTGLRRRSYTYGHSA